MADKHYIQDTSACGEIIKWIYPEGLTNDVEKASIFNLSNAIELSKKNNLFKIWPKKYIDDQSTTCMLICDAHFDRGFKGYNDD